MAQCEMKVLFSPSKPKLLELGLENSPGILWVSRNYVLRPQSIEFEGVRHLSIHKLRDGIKIHMSPACLEGFL